MQVSAEFFAHSFHLLRFEPVGTGLMALSMVWSATSWAGLNL